MSNSTQYTGPSAVSQLAVGVLLLVLAVVLWLNAHSLPPAQAMGVGPAAALRLTALFLLLLAVFHAFSAWHIKKNHTSSIAPSDLKADHTSLAWGIGGMLCMIAVIALDGGFIIASTLLFSLTARAFGKRIGVKSMLIGLTLSTLASLFFTKLIMLTRPFGPIESFLYGGL